MARILTIRDRALQSKDAIELLAQKWRITVLHLLHGGRLRTSELQSAIGEISPKVLTETLRSMERDGLIERRVFAAVPPRVEYSLTPMGLSLLKPLQDLCRWAHAHVGQRDEARARYDALDRVSGSPKKRFTVPHE